MSDGFLDLIIRNEDSVVAHWLRLGADGFRLDVADELPDEFIALLRKRVKEIDPQSFIIITKTSEIMGKGFRDNINN